MHFNSGCGSVMGLSTGTDLMTVGLVVKAMESGTKKHKKAHKNTGSVTNP